MFSMLLLGWSAIAMAMHLAFAIGWLPGNVYLVVLPIGVGLLGHLITLTVAGRWDKGKATWTELRQAWGPAAPWCSFLYLYAGLLVVLVIYFSVTAGDRSMTSAELQYAGAIFSVLSAAWCIGNWGVLRLPRTF